LIAPLLISVAIVPALDTPEPPRPAPAAAPIAPLLVSVAIAPAFDTPAPPAPAEVTPPPRIEP